MKVKDGIKKYKNDIILIGSLLLAVIIVLIIMLMLSGKSGNEAYVYHNDEVVLKLNLKTDGEYTVTGDVSLMTIVVKNGSVSVTESGCKDSSCIHEGSISKSGKTITCLPNRIYIKVISSEGADASV